MPERWKIFGVLILILVANWLVAAVFGVVGLSQAAEANEVTFRFSATALLLSLIPSTLFNLAWGTVQAALYVELRQAKEGGSVEGLEEVFS